MIAIPSLHALPVWIFAGQSNMDGSVPVELIQQLDPQFGNRPEIEVFVWKRNEWGTFGTPQTVLKRARGLDLYGPEVGFAEVVQASGQFPKFGIIKYAHGNTSLKNHWTAGKGARYIGLLNTIREALARKPDCEVMGIFWLQGENDAPWAAADEYEKNFRAFITQLREDLELPQLPLIVAKIASPNMPEKIEGVRKVQRAQQAVADSVPSAVAIGIEDVPLLEDRLHYTPEGSLQIGRRLAETWLMQFHQTPSVLGSLSK